jgi:hypothetical protein
MTTQRGRENAKKSRGSGIAPMTWAKRHEQIR